jgi:hypothetical protein
MMTSTRAFLTCPGLSFPSRTRLPYPKGGANASWFALPSVL